MATLCSKITCINEDINFSIKKKRFKNNHRKIWKPWQADYKENSSLKIFRCDGMRELGGPLTLREVPVTWTYSSEASQQWMWGKCMRLVYSSHCLVTKEHPEVSEKRLCDSSIVPATEQDPSAGKKWQRSHLLKERAGSWPSTRSLAFPLGDPEVCDRPANTCECNTVPVTHSHSITDNTQGLRDCNTCMWSDARQIKSEWVRMKAHA